VLTDAGSIPAASTNSLGSRTLLNIVTRIVMPPKIRELISQLQRAGFSDRGGEGSHRNFTHPRVSKPVTISGRPGEDAKQYQLKAVRMAIEESQR